MPSQSAVKDELVDDDEGPPFIIDINAMKASAGDDDNTGMGDTGVASAVDDNTGVASAVDDYTGVDSAGYDDNSAGDVTTHQDAHNGFNGNT